MITAPLFISDLRQQVPVEELSISDHVWDNRHRYIRWPSHSLLFMPGVTRATKYHTYTQAQMTNIRASNVKPDARSNGPAVMAFLLAGGERPWRGSGQKQWTVHHAYDGQHPKPGRGTSTRAVIIGDYFTEAAGLVAVHPIADALADEFAYFAWLLRFEAFQRFRFDPNGVFTQVAVHNS